MRALVFRKFGGPDVLGIEELPVPVLVPGTALVRMRAVGMNFADVYRRRGTYHLDGAAPWILGYEGAGVVEAVRPPERADASLPAIAVGDRVAFADVPRANAELVLAPLDHLIPIPSPISFETAAAVLLQGLTAHYLVHDSHALAAGETVLVHAAAGGVGLLLTQLAKAKGATVIALASTAEKRAIALANGADHALGHDRWVMDARALGRGGAGVDVVYDSVGTTLKESLAAAKKGGHVVFYGMAAGDPEPVGPRRLMDESKSLTGGDLWNVLTSSAERIRRASELFAAIDRGALKVRIAAELPLERGAEAHALLEGRKTVGKVLLIPSGARHRTMTERLH
jgi:NADPH2:quinone reductase